MHELEKIEVPAAEDFEQLTTHRAPRALAQGAATEDWPGFLGARRDGTSRESIQAFGRSANRGTTTTRRSQSKTD